MSKLSFLFSLIILLNFKSFSQLPSKIDIQWALVPAGSFTMGSPETEIGHEFDEVQHDVNISSFYVSKFEITYDQYMFFVKETNYKKPDSDGLQKGSHPIVNVSWEDANNFCKWLGVRLLTEAEWEYICRAGTSTPFYYGDVITSEQVNFDGNHPYNRSPKSDFFGKSKTVGSYKPNKWGIYDLHGNVWEWVSDWVAPYNLEDKNNPLGPKESKLERVGRGGSFFDGAEEVRCAQRGGTSATTFGEQIGFRVAKNL